RRFVQAYDGNGTKAACEAGYSGSDSVLRVTASRLLTNDNVVAAIQTRQTVEEQPLIADRQRRQQFWSKVMQDNDEDMRTRLRASELLGRSEGDFIDRHEHSGNDGGAILIDAIERGRRIAGLVSLAKARSNEEQAHSEH